MVHSLKVIDESFRNRYWAVQHRHVAQALQLKTIDLLAQAERTLKQAAELVAKNGQPGQAGHNPQTPSKQQAAIG